MKRLADLRQPAQPANTSKRRGIAEQSFSRRGWGQRPQRQREQILRANVVDIQHWTREQGLSALEAAACLGLAPRTLRQWQLDAQTEMLRIQPLGRPLLRSSRQDRNEVIEVLQELGPATGVPTLKDCFPSMPRAELEDVLQRYRRIWRIRHVQAQHVLRWQMPGTVWAMDFAQPPHPIDGLYLYLLAVRDLASGQQLLWLPVTLADAAQVVCALRSLFALHGAPLVMKTDNGSPFCADPVQELLATQGVIPLFSPPALPRYNGAIEAGIGSLKTRTEQQATLNGRPTFWSFSDVDAAQTQANATSRPKGSSGPTANELWSTRPMATAETRGRFLADVQRHRSLVRTSEPWSALEPLTDKHERAIDRHAIRRALVEHDLLLFRRRRIPLPFNTKNAAGIR